MAKRRSNTEIEKDFLIIRELIETGKVTSVDEIARKLDLSVAQIEMSLSRHPRVSKKLLSGLEKVQNNSVVQTEKKEHNDFEVGFVIDASITGVPNFDDIIEKIVTTEAVIILTSVTIRELEKLQKGKDTEARDARHILAEAARNPKSFKNVLIDETVGIPDDCIIAFCKEYKDTVTLLTSDKTMCLKARMFGVDVSFQEQQVSTPSSNKGEGEFVITEFNTSDKGIMVMRNNREYTSGPLVLEKGDEIFLAQKEGARVIFTHYKVILINDEKKVKKLICRMEITHKKELEKLPNRIYRGFMRDYFMRHDIY